MTASRRVLNLDIETNGVEGEPFAVRASVFDTTAMGDAIVFEARCPIVGPVDPWAAQHVLPRLERRPVTHTSHLEMMAAYRAFWAQHKDAIDLLIDEVGQRHCAPFEDDGGQRVQMNAGSPACH